MKPKIVIKHGRLIEPFFKPYIEQKYPDYIFPTKEFVVDKVKLFRKTWTKYEDIFLNGLKDINLEFTRNRIDVLIIAATDRDMSCPLIIRSRYDEKEFISVLFHELLHNLFNDISLIRGYEEETEQTISHIYLFAVLEYLFVDVLNEPERLDIEKSKSNPNKNADYYRAWKIVEEEGYKNIIKKIKHAK